MIKRGKTNREEEERPRKKNEEEEEKEVNHSGRGCKKKNWAVSMDTSQRRENSHRGLVQRHNAEKKASKLSASVNPLFYKKQVSEADASRTKSEDLPHPSTPLTRIPTLYHKAHSFLLQSDN
ncbi:hypothetical protein CEXT_538011 [Caerostris extrusa]|uniref:Uncharacterized protein n=1 Tax=Caerostris extrusa TaxID=172846 RepID=A0AAV4XMJ8_CAEEX|nr:hypothetical protein CEXT_538011 [Caerostris extrusa]